MGRRPGWSWWLSAAGWTRARAPPPLPTRTKPTTMMLRAVLILPAGRGALFHRPPRWWCAPLVQSRWRPPLCGGCFVGVAKRLARVACRREVEGERRKGGSRAHFFSLGKPGPRINVRRGAARSDSGAQSMGWELTLRGEERARDKRERARAPPHSREVDASCFSGSGLVALSLRPAAGVKREVVSKGSGTIKEQEVTRLCCVLVCQEVKCVNVVGRVGAVESGEARRGRGGVAAEAPSLALPPPPRREKARALLQSSVGDE
jgi:hypothetical protein